MRNHKSNNCRHGRCKNGYGIGHLSNLSLSRPEFIVHGALDVINAQELDVISVGLLSDLNQTIR